MRLSQAGALAGHGARGLAEGPDLNLAKGSAAPSLWASGTSTSSSAGEGYRYGSLTAPGPPKQLRSPPQAGSKRLPADPPGAGLQGPQAGGSQRLPAEPPGAGLQGPQAGAQRLPADPPGAGRPAPQAGAQRLPADPPGAGRPAPQAGAQRLPADPPGAGRPAPQADAQRLPAEQSGAGRGYLLPSRTNNSSLLLGAQGPREGAQGPQEGFDSVSSVDSYPQQRRAPLGGASGGPAPQASSWTSPGAGPGSAASVGSGAAAGVGPGGLGARGLGGAGGPGAAGGPSAGGPSAAGGLGAGGLGARGGVGGGPPALQNPSTADVRESPFASSLTLPPNKERPPFRSPPAQNRDLELRVQELVRANAELERRLDEDGLKFLEAIAGYETQVKQLTEQNKQLSAEHAAAEDHLRLQGDPDNLRAMNQRMEKESQDILQQLDEFEREKEEELKLIREEAAGFSQQLEDQEQHYSRLLAQAERDRDNLLQAMTDEGQELQLRIDKLSRDKEALSMDLAKALARADMVAAGGEGAGLSEAMGQLRSVVGEREALKDEVTTKDGQLVLLRSHIETTERKLRLTDMENAMLKSELEVLRRGVSLGHLGHVR